MFVKKVMVKNHQRNHCLSYGHGAGRDAGVVAAVDFDVRRVAVAIHGLLPLSDAGGRFKGEAHDDGFSVADAAQNAAGVVGNGADAVKL